MRICRSIGLLVLVILLIAAPSFSEPAQSGREKTYEAASNGRISILFPGDDRTEVHCVDAKTGKLRWRFRGQRYFCGAEISPMSNRILATYSRRRPIQDSESYCDSAMVFDMSGHIVWDKYVGGQAVTSPSWKYLLVTNEGMKLGFSILRSSDGRLLWRRAFSDPRLRPVASFTRDEKRVFTYSPDDVVMYTIGGRREWRYSARPGWIESASTSGNGSLTAVLKGDTPLIVTLGPRGQVINKAVPQLESPKASKQWWFDIIVSVDGSFILLESAVGDPYVGFDSRGRQIWTFTPPDWDKPHSLAGMRALPSGNIAIDLGVDSADKAYVVDRHGKLLSINIHPPFE